MVLPVCDTCKSATVHAHDRTRPVYSDHAMTFRKCLGVMALLMAGQRFAVAGAPEQVTMTWWDAAPLIANKYVEVTLTSGSRLIGRVTDVTDYGFSLSTPMRTQTVQRDSVSRIGVVRYHGPWRTIGGAAGAAVGVAAGIGAAKKSGEGLGVIPIGIVGGAVGAGVGAIGDRHKVTIILRKG